MKEGGRGWWHWHNVEEGGWEVGEGERVQARLKLRRRVLRDECFVAQIIAKKVFAHAVPTRTRVQDCTRGQHLRHAITRTSLVTLSPY
jgi:hypothetical protein